MHLYYSFAVVLGNECVGYVGAYEAPALVGVEATLKYHPFVL